MMSVDGMALPFSYPSGSCSSMVTTLPSVLTAAIAVGPRYGCCLPLVRNRGVLSLWYSEGGYERRNLLLADFEVVHDAL